MDEERDVVVFSDDEGNEFELDVIDYFEYEGQEYAILMDLSTSAEDECECDDEENEDAGQQDVYIMKVVVKGDVEEFLPADEELMDVLSEIVEKRLSEDGECGCSCDCDGGECGCD
ncbi:MAG: DUF1292 domain-containing protein [Bacillota bacterium]